jgi:hypothetical protein
MSAGVKLMLLPSLTDEGLPRVLLDEEGIWREIQHFAAEPQSQLRQGVEEFLESVMSKVGGMPQVEISPRGTGFKKPFVALMRALLPTEVRESLARFGAAGPGDDGMAPRLEVVVAPGTDWIPWELLHDDQDFLGLRFQIARLPIVKQATSVPGPRRREVRQVLSLLANNVLAGESRGTRPSASSTRPRGPTSCT